MLKKALIKKKAANRAARRNGFLAGDCPASAAFQLAFALYHSPSFSSGTSLFLGYHFIAFLAFHARQ